AVKALAARAEGRFCFDETKCRYATRHRSVEKGCMILEEYAQNGVRPRRPFSSNGYIARLQGTVRLRFLTTPQLGGRLPWLSLVQSVAALTCGHRCDAPGN